MTSETVNMIVSICALLTSVAAFVVSIIFSCLQVKHNRTSVKPIASIVVGDYENLIYVEIRNVGTGPLTINSLIIEADGDDSFKRLIDLFPNIGQMWDDFVDDVAGRTIGVKGKLVLLRISPQSDEVRRILREKLAKVKVTVKYSDIYKKKQPDANRTLDFFGRHDRKPEAIASSAAPASKYMSPNRK